MTTPLLLLLLLAAAPRAAAQDDESVEGTEIRTSAGPSDKELAMAMKEQMRRDPRIADSLAQRIARSSIAPRITEEADPQRKAQAIRQWIDSDPDSAAGLAVGLSKDDASGTHRFEEIITRETKTNLRLNPNSNKGIYGRLRKASKDSRLMKKDEEMADEERREILKSMFEGQGSQSGRIITEKGEKTPDKSASAAFNSGIYDRLSKGNLRGYSPQLQTLQSAMNTRRPPGAPALIETGKLDYDTLSYPKYSMRWDIGNLEKRLRYERNLALAKLLGKARGLTPEQLLDPALEAQLQAEAGAKSQSLSPRFQKRLDALKRAADAVSSFETTALPSRDPLKITRELLLGLGGRQKEASRWITVASLEEELQRLEAEEGFLTPELKDAVNRAPVETGGRAAYWRRGEEFLKRLKSLKDNDEQAIKMLETDSWVAQIDAIEKLLDANGELRRDLSRNISDFVKTPFRLAALQNPQPRWKEILDSLYLRFLPSSARARELRMEAGQRDVLKDVFMKIAMGNLEAAHTILAANDPSGGPPSKR